MSRRAQSLLEYLIADNPDVFDASLPEGRNTTNSSMWSSPVRIEQWEDFTLESLKAMFNGMLSRMLQGSHTFRDFSSIPNLPFCEIGDENSFDSLIVKWNQSVVSDALEAAQHDSRVKWNNDTVFMVKGGQAKWPHPKSKPDWAAVQRAQDFVMTSAKLRNILPGETKLGKKWSSGQIQEGPIAEDEATSDWIQPIRQIFTYCAHGNVRYGYIITYKELVAIRIRARPLQNEEDPNSSNNGGKNKSLPPDPPPHQRVKSFGILEYKSVPWSHANGADGLTVNLALWWLHMMAASDCAIDYHYDSLGDEEYKATATASTPITPALTSPATITPIDQSFAASEYNAPSSSTAAQSFDSAGSRRKRSQDSGPGRKGKRRSGPGTRD